MSDHVTDAIECFHEMMTELGGEVYMSGPMTEWVSGEFVFYLFVYRTFNFCGQISPIDVSLLPRAQVTHLYLTLPSSHRSPHHF